MMGLPGKPDGIDGAEVEKYVREGRIAEVAAYCETECEHVSRLAALRIVPGETDRERFARERR